MYFSKDFLLYLYKKLSSLYPGGDIEKQGGTQFVSALKYFIAMDAFKKETAEPCNSRMRDDKDLFVECVGKTVFLSETPYGEKFYTKNFASSVGESKDYDIGSNFFSAGAVKVSLSSSEPLIYPTRYPELLTIDKGVVDVLEVGYQNIAEAWDYLGGNIEKFALLFLWLNRYTDFSSEQSVCEEGLKNLKKTYSSKLINALQWNKDSVKNEVVYLLTFASFSDDLEYIQKEDLGSNEDNDLDMESTDDVEAETSVEVRNMKYIQNATQLIYYGVPGSGKSHVIDGIIKNYPESQKVRVVFHPEYTNADFVGQVLPKSEDGNIKYEFKPGPFTKILYRAYHNPYQKYFLVIEEINRGNAAAIFGDIFQLLDRIKNGDETETLDGNTYGTGWSKYFVENDYINNYLRSPVEYNQNGFTENHEETDVSFGGGITFTPNTGIRLPPNLSLYATMNTSDQNVFTLDNAFQRRWDMALVENKFTDDLKSPDYQKGNIQRNKKIEGTETTWEQFQKHINALIERETAASGLSSMEDKRLGCWFIKTEESVIPKKLFAEKVLKYLWDDAFKFSRENIFQEEYKSLEALENAFKGDVGFGIFKDRNFNSQE